jgi:hypothetical protein
MSKKKVRAFQNEIATGSAVCAPPDNIAAIDLHRT